MWERSYLIQDKQDRHHQEKHTIVLTRINNYYGALVWTRSTRTRKRGKEEHLMMQFFL